MIDHETIVLLLGRLGFSSKEAKIYLTLLELNEASPNVVAQRAGLRRPTTYLILEALERRGLASHVKMRSGRFYRATSPEVFIDSEKRRNEQLNKTLEILQDALPEIAALHAQYNITPQMSVFHGKEGLIQIMEDTLTSKGEILCWSNADLAVNTLLKDYHPVYLKRKVKRKIYSRCLFLEDAVGQAFKKRSKKELREVRFLPKTCALFVNEINIYDDKVSIISHKDAVGVIIQNKAIADTQKAIFDLCFCIF